MTIDEWLRKEGLTEEQAAERCKVTHDTINRLRRFATNPGLALALRIEHGTGRKVRAYELLSDNERRAIYGERGRP